MRNFGSSHASGNIGEKREFSKHSIPDLINSDSDNEISSGASKEEGLECPICCGAFNIVENVPYVLWCGHTMCNSCISGLKWAVMRFPNLPVQFPLFISCPWCNQLSPRLVYRGELRFPRKNYFLMWMVESRNGDRVNYRSTSAKTCRHQQNRLKWDSLIPENQGENANCRRRQMHNARQTAISARTDSEGSTRAVTYLTMERLHTSQQKSLVFFVHFIAKLPLVIVFLLVVVYAVPACAAILVIYIMVTLVFAIPSFLTLYFAYPGLDWLVGEIVS